MVALNARPLADFDRPIDMMQDCHRRVERFLASLVKAGAEAPQPLTEEWAQLLRTALDYFEGAAPLHTQDEEISLFPRLREHASEPRVAEALDVIGRLERDHDAAEPLHEEQEELGRSWLATGRLDELRRERFTQLSEQLRQLYERHIALEDDHIYVVARTVIDTPTQARIGVEMRERRGGRRCGERKATTRALRGLS